MSGSTIYLVACGRGFLGREFAASFLDGCTAKRTAANCRDESNQHQMRERFIGDVRDMEPELANSNVAAQQEAR